MKVNEFILTILITSVMASCGYKRIRYISSNNDINQSLPKTEQSPNISDTKYNLNIEPLAQAETDENGTEIIFKTVTAANNNTTNKNITHSITSKRNTKTVLLSHYDSTEQNSGYHDDEAKSKFGTSITLLSLSIITLGFTYLIGLGVFISACVHFAKTRNKSKSTKIRFWIALTLVILMTAFFILAPIILLGGV